MDKGLTRALGGVVAIACGVGAGSWTIACTGSDPDLSGTVADASAPDAASVDGATGTDASDAGAEAGGEPLGCDPKKPFTTFTNIAELSSPNEESTLALSSDELHVVIVSLRDGSAKYWSASRATNPGAFGPLREETFNFGTGAPQQSALSRDGLTLYVATGAGGAPFKLTRLDPSSPFGNGVSIAIPSSMTNALPVGTFFTAVGTLLVTGTNQAGGPSERSLWEWSGANFTSAELVLGSPSNGVALTDPVLSKDGSTLFYARADSNQTGKREIWQTSRTTLNDPFPSPGAVLADLAGNTDAAPHFLSDDGCRLYFSTQDRPGGKGGRDFWLASRGK